jgi:radical SAM protein with 4Fe4S-binding SPASM domain
MDVVPELRMRPERINTSGAVIREVAGLTLASDPTTGAFSALAAAEAIAFHLLSGDATVDDVSDMFRRLGRSDEEARAATAAFVSRLECEGWARTGYPEGSDGPPLQSIYFTVSRDCNLACPYCYQGLAARRGRHMELAAAGRIIDDAHALNPNCHIVVTGGEPLLHPQFFEVLDAIRARGLTMSLLSNGVLIDDSVAARLRGYENLELVQISLDGLCEETHAQTRGKASFAPTMAGIKAVARHGLPLLLAPTIHEGNADEIVGIARLAIDLGGFVSPNDLRELPAAVKGKVHLRPGTVRRVLRDLGTVLGREYGDDLLRQRQNLGRRACSTAQINARFNCGMAHALVDVDWNGDVYPCHLLKGDALRLGNVLDVGFSALLAGAAARGFRVKAYDIPKCRDCSFMSVCGGGCRVGSYFRHGSFARESDMCGQYYSSNLDRRLRAKGLEG